MINNFNFLITDFERRLKQWDHFKNAISSGKRNEIVALVTFSVAITLIAKIIESMVTQYFTSNSASEPACDPVSETVFIFCGSQTGCVGFVNSTRAKSLCKELQNKQVAGIQFNERKVDSYIEGGHVLQWP